jgi:NADPH-dependent glutamate synthase beta subunit-like oxidoreductase/ferredoxin
VSKNVEPAGGRTPLADVLLQPAQVAGTPPCGAGCAAGGDPRGWIGVVAQRHKLGLSDEDAYTRAWDIVVSANPFPASLGRICPHPCESGCNRKDKDGAVAINALERFLGDWALRKGLVLPVLDPGPLPESIGVIGAGPAGLSFAYQMTRRGYRVTVYEQQDRPGGMLYYGIPQYRLPEDVLLAEIRRLEDLRIDIRLGTVVGRDVGVAELRERHAALFFGVGAGRGLRLGVPGEDGAGVLTGIEYLGATNRGETPAMGRRVVVVGGGNTAMDAARTARRSGAQVTVLYRRGAEEMPAIKSEIDAAVAEGVVLELLAAPVAIARERGAVRTLVARRMRLAGADATGRRAVVPVAGSEFELVADTVIAAVSQEADWTPLAEIDAEHRFRHAQLSEEAEAGLLAGGDALGPGIAALAIAQGRQAAEALHARLRGLAGPPPGSPPPPRPGPAVRSDNYAARARAALPTQSVEERLAQPDAEVDATIGEDAFLAEVERCFSCGLCFGCEQCFTFCNAGGFVRLEEPRPGAYFALALDACEACRKCIEVCPCGYLSAVPRPPASD